jgi:hypothetical protein
MPNEEQALSAATPPELAAKKEEEESEMDVEDGKARPSTAMMGMLALDMTSPSICSGGWPRNLKDGDESGPEDGYEGEEEKRGRRGTASESQIPLSLYRLARERLSLYL